MTRIASGIVYYTIYSFLYSIPFICLWTISAALNFDLPKFINELGLSKAAIEVLVLVCLVLLPGYRAKLASDAYGDRDMKFWEAHSVSGAILKSHLSFLPIVGKFFR